MTEPNLRVELGRCSEAAKHVDFDSGTKAYRVQVLCGGEGRGVEEAEGDSGEMDEVVSQGELFTYSVRTYDWDLGEYTPQTDPWQGLTIWQLKAALKQLKELGYTCHRVRGEDGEHWDNDTSVLVERCDQTIPAHRVATEASK